MSKSVLAIHAHPDDIEFMMAGTMLRMAEVGYDLHYMNIANGCCGSMTQNAADAAATRLEEAKAAAKTLGATFHPPIANDIEIFYTDDLIRKVAAVVREVNPSVMLVPSPQDYMEDHTVACRLAVTAGFVRGMPNYQSDPPRDAVEGSVTLYHALPWGLRDQLRHQITADCYVDITPVMETKKAALACHASQKVWLDQTQGLDSYLVTMENMSKEVGDLTGRFTFAEGWRRHLHLGFCGENDDPLRDALGEASRG